MNTKFRWKQIIKLTIVLAIITSCQPEILDPITPEKKEVAVLHEVFEIDILVANSAPIVSKENEDYLKCSVIIDGKGIESDYRGTAKVRGRGNSTWLWYDKKPYRIKLDEKSEILGLKSNSDWVLLANYRDPTNLMNAFGFEVAKWLGLPFTNNTRFVEVNLNGEYIGLYQLTEQVEQGNNRVDIDEIDGVLLSLDKDDGPGLNQDAANNFWSEVFKMPVSIKYPKEPTTAQISEIQTDFLKLEKAIQAYNYDSVAVLLDIPSFIDYLILQELVYNVEIDAPRSVFVHRDKDSKYVMGPVWDFDAGFDFDWGTMYSGHNYFREQQLVLGTDPARHTNGYRIPVFFTQLFRNKQFVEKYKKRWNDIKDDIFENSWDSMEFYRIALQDAMERDLKRWPIDKMYDVEIDKMHDWLSERIPYLTTVINNYPAGALPAIKVDCGTIETDVTLLYSLGYKQSVTVNIDENKLISMMGITREKLYSDNMKIVPLNVDDSEGLNNTNGKFGAWFEADNNPGEWSNGHVYIEIFDHLTSWDCGLRAGEEYCSIGDRHSVRMQYQYTQDSETKILTIIVNFTITNE